eukprot:2445694-Pyramimonas_sp.AAC.1
MYRHVVFPVLVGLTFLHLAPPPPRRCRLASGQPAPRRPSQADSVHNLIRSTVHVLQDPWPAGGAH